MKTQYFRKASFLIGLYWGLAWSAYTQDDRSMVVGAPEKRLALVIGNANYSGANSLCFQNGVCPPINDANDLGAALKLLDFEVIQEANNAGKEKMRRLLNEFETKLRDGGYQVALFYFAGHGTGLETGNYLYPIDVPMDISETDVEDYCINVNTVLRKIDQASVQTRIVLLDACRDNPYERAWSRSTLMHGLREVESPDETFVGFAAKPRSVAANKSPNNRNGLFTYALLKHLNTKGGSLDELFVAVTMTVKEESRKIGANQTPERRSNLSHSFSFVGGTPIDVPKNDSDPDRDGLISPTDKCPDEYGLASNDGCPEYIHFGSIKPEWNAYVDFCPNCGDDGIGYNFSSLEEREAGAQKGNSWDQYYLGWTFLMGEAGHFVNYSLAYTWLKKSADQGHANALYHLGLMSEFGLGETADLAKAKRLYSEAMSSGSKLATLRLNALNGGK